MASHDLRSSRNQYDSRESRASSRDRSPGRYNDIRDSDQYRGGAGRGERRRSIDSRSGSGAFTSGRDSYNRESSRDFPPREPPRGPKALIDPPSGPRATSYGGDYRGDFGHRGDFRGRGRGRARGGWRDESRDRGREPERERGFARDRRDDRGPPPPFRDDRSRDRDWGRERESSFKARRPSPQPRPRSPNYNSRDIRDVPPSLEPERARRESRDGPVLTPSASSESLQSYARGGFSTPYRGRGGRGRGRGGFYEDYRSQSGRSRSPDPQFTRKPQPSATPPPQVPAFGSTSTPVPVAPANSTLSASAGPVPGVAVPTAPRAHVPGPRNSFGRPQDATAVKWVNPDYAAAKLIKQSPETPKTATVPSLPSKTFSPPLAPAQSGEAWGHRNVQSVSDSGRNSETIQHAISRPLSGSIPQGPRSLESTLSKPSAPTPFEPMRASSLSEAELERPKSDYSPPPAQIEPEPPVQELETMSVPAQASLAQEPDRRPILSRRRPKPGPARIPRDEMSEDDSSDDGGINENYFEEEIANIKEQLTRHNEFLPRQLPKAIVLKLPSEPPILDELRGKTIRSLIHHETDEKTSIVVTVPEPDQQADKDVLPGDRESQNQTADGDVEMTSGEDPSIPNAPVSPQQSDIALVKKEEDQETTDGTAEAADQAEADAAMSNTQLLPDSASATNNMVVNSAEREDVETPVSMQEPESQPLVEDKASVVLKSPRASRRPHPDNNSDDANDKLVEPATSNTLTDIAKADDESSVVATVPDVIPSAETPELSTKMDIDEENTEETTEETTEAQQEIQLEEIEAVRRKMKTPPIASVRTLPFFGIKKWDQDEEFLQSLTPNPTVERVARRNKRETLVRRSQQQEIARQEWKQRYLDYRRWTDFSNDPIAKKYRTKYEKAAEARAAENAQPAATIEARAEGRRGTSRFASELEYERILKESAMESKAAEEESIAKRTASEKEAIIPEQYWDAEERLEETFVDRTHLVPFDRSLALLEFGEPVDNFSEEEVAAFEKAYLEFPKQWGKIAEALPRRDFKACIQHYYLIKHSSDLKGKVKKLRPKRGKRKGAGGAKPKSNALMADLTLENEDDKQENDTDGGRRRPRRAAAASQYNTAASASEAAPSESENATPVPTPARKSAGTPKGEPGSAAPAKRKTKGAPREKAPKQSKNSQLLAAAPAGTSRQPEGPSTPSSAPEWKINPHQSVEQNRFAPQYDGPNQMQPQTTFSPYIPPQEKKLTPVPVNFETAQPFQAQERIGSAPPGGLESQQDRRNVQQTSSYWSVPEQTDFPALLRHFGTDWHGIAKWMTSKTHIMVYTTVFQHWLAVPSDSNKSRRVANIQTQVKNYYQRQVDSGKMSEWEGIAKEADEKRERGESTGPLPTPTVVPKRRPEPMGYFDRTEPTITSLEDLTPGSQNQAIPLQRVSPQPQSVLNNNRFPTLAQAGTHPQSVIQPPTSVPSPKKSLHPQSAQQMSQQIQQNPRPSNGPQLGLFTVPRERNMNANPNQPVRPSPLPLAGEQSISQRSLMAAQEAQLERQNALKIEQQQQQAQQAMERERAERERAERERAERDRLDRERDREREQREQRERMLKQEHEMRNNMQQYEPYSTQSMQANVMAHARHEIPQQPAEIRRTAPPPQQYQRNPQVRNIMNESMGQVHQMPSASPSPAIPRAPMSAPPMSQEQFAAPPPQPTPPAPVRQPEPRKTSSIMSLLNDEPSEPRPQPPPQPAKRNSDFAPSSLQISHTPPPAREQMYSQPPREPTVIHAPQIRRESSLNDIHGLVGGYGRPSAPGQPRLNQSPYSASAATPPPQQQQQQPPPPSQQPIQGSRQHIASPLEMAQPSDRDYYQRQPPQYMMQQQQQASAAGSPHLGPSYHTQAQQQQQQHQQAQQQQSHRQMAFGQAASHVASPPPQYASQQATQHSVRRSRQNSFDGRYGPPASAAGPQPPQQGYPHASQHGSMQYQPQHPLQPSRYAAPSSQSAPSPVQQMPQHIAAQQAPTAPHGYGPHPSHPMHQHSSSIGPPRSYTPSNYDSRGHAPPPQGGMGHERMIHPEHEAAMKHEAMLRQEMDYRMQQQQQRHSVDHQYDQYTQRRLDDENRRRMEGRR
ncbi:hypothetical protein BP6252_00060 [Coleophoma cylindrospora]|uniref:SANT domain-containing protein n=1 Tax=Coleophoma cylindrospora TaxID=1849047 RepID=A0A3D8SQF2_9HELO|nr:hypothetical protein BP6252_00060 [Coleophoma cylindrospora]